MKTWTGLDDIDPTSSVNVEEEQATEMKKILGEDLYMSLDRDEKLIEILTGEHQLKSVWPWEPVSRLVRWCMDKPIFVTPSLDKHITDYSLQRAAAIEYLDKRKPKPKVVDITPPIMLPIAIILFLLGLLGLYGLL